MKRKLSEKIAEQLIMKIEQGQWKPHQKLPPEKELAKYFDVSRNTLREAVHSLVEAGYVKRIHGSGTIVLPPAINYGMSTLFSISDLIRQSGDSHRKEILELTIEKPTSVLAEQLRIPKLDPVHKLVRLHYVNDIPSVYEVVYFISKLISGVTEEVFKDSIFKFLENNGLVPTYADGWFRATRPSIEIARIMGISSNMPMMEHEMLIYDQHNRPICLAIDLFSDMFRFPIRRVRRKLTQDTPSLPFKKQIIDGQKDQ
jgi:DNA-binding GntR family transcriptional regulator